MALRVVSTAELDRLSRAAGNNFRLRLNLNLHDDFAEPCQRLFNAVEPGSYIRPHRHSEPPKAETFVVIRGRFCLFLFDAAGQVAEWIELAPAGPVVAVDIPAGRWHTIASLAAGSIFFEAKPGPYVAMSDKDFPAWAPPEGSNEADGYLQGLLATMQPEG